MNIYSYTHYFTVSKTESDFCLVRINQYVIKLRFCERVMCIQSFPVTRKTHSEPVITAPNGFLKQIKLQE